MSRVVMEACVDSLASACAAARGGAARLELCAALSEGGLTPTPGMLRAVLACVPTQMRVFVLLRPRAGHDFVYSDGEMQAMEHDVKLLKEAGAHGVVLGVLKPDGVSLDEEACRRLISAAAPLPVTLHRAFDCAVARGADPEALLDSAVATGFRRLLTSGGAASAERGLDVLRRLVRHAGGRVAVMPGAGITDRNLQRVLAHTGAAEFHASARHPVCTSSPEDDGSPRIDDHALMVTSEDMVRRMVSIASAHTPHYEGTGRTQ